MSSLWTPEGEHRVPREGEPPAEPSPSPSPRAPDERAGVAAGAADAAGSGSAGQHLGDDGAPEELAQELAALERELLEAPAADVVANHCYGLFQLAALHLGARPPHLDDARLAIDALGAVVDGLGPRLGSAATSLSDGLAQIRLAYVQISGAAGPADGSGVAGFGDANGAGGAAAS